MGPQQHAGVVELGKLFVVDGDEALLMESLHLHTVVDNVAEAIELAGMGQFLLSLLDGSGDAEAEAAAVVYLNFYVHWIAIRIYK